MFKYILQLLIGGFVFLFSSLAAWYEGSGIIENSLEWKYSTPISTFLGIEIETGKEIVVLDYFVYAIKFKPFFPLLMLLCSIYMIVITLVLIGRANNQLALKLAFAYGLLNLAVSTLFYKATTTGGIAFFYILLLNAILTILISKFLYIQSKQKQYHLKASK